MTRQRRRADSLLGSSFSFAVDRRTFLRASGGGLLALGFGGLLTACGTSEPTTVAGGGTTAAGATPAGGGSVVANTSEIDPTAILRRAVGQSVGTFDPHKLSNPWDMEQVKLVYDQLMTEGEPGVVEPMLATEWEFGADGRSLTMKLRDDVKFHDGEAFNADAVKANLDRARTLEGGTLVGALKVIDSVDVDDEFTVTIKLNGPSGDLPALFTERYGTMISPKALSNADLDQNPVGSGMFKLTEFIPQQSAKYEAVPGYWQPDAVKLAGLEFFTRPDETTVLNMFSAGELEIGAVAGGSIGLAEERGLIATPTVGTSVMRISMNTGKAPFNDLRVRQAMEHAIDKEAVIAGVYFGAATAVSSMIPPTHWAANPDVTPANPDYSYDPEKAKALLAEAGLTAPVPFEFLVPSTSAAATEAVVPMLEAVGFAPTLKNVEDATVPTVFFGEQQGNAYFGNEAPWIDPTTPYRQNLPGDFRNPWNTYTDEFLEFYQKALEGGSNEDRLPALQGMIKAEKQMMRTFGCFAPQGVIAYTTNVVYPEGYIARPIIDYHGVGLSKA